MGRRGRRGGPYGVDDGTAVVSARGRAYAARLERLAADYRLRNAALVADTFGLDPVDVLAERDPFRRLIRLAAHNYLQSEAQKAQSRTT